MHSDEKHEEDELDWGRENDRSTKWIFNKNDYAPYAQDNESSPILS